MLAVTLVPTLRSTLNQQSQINALRDQLGQQRETVAAMQQEQRQWSDPVFLEQQARERLKFVRVGETSYTVIDPQTAPPASGDLTIAAPAAVSTFDGPWYGQLWQSMVIADTPAKAAVKAPVKAPAQSQPSPASSAR
ncbi:MAG TPA: septum formation initiator family protein [Dermatophilaceae bacterium]|nr:septum formation initiator family protein [Dermatophilaceae bacterium]